MTEKVIIAGAGGQGVMLLGKIIAEAAMRENKHVTWLPAYGAEVRGGASYCMVVMSDQNIGSPIIEQANSLIIMNGPSFQKFHTKITKNGLCLLNSSLVTKEITSTTQAASKIHYVECPFTEIALELGNIKVANVVALGCYSAQNKLIQKKTFLRVIEDIAPSDKKELIEINKQAFSKGSEGRYG